ncbi:PAAR-like domain-containing protein [uncultured Ruegeria sp.]|uniref:PAAR-like domain-containing protein n=1 Tax=uncultured Ruegeria sp. TaxID=259304 RepID=UPI0026023667|nr:PAAR-like domain-containing protein [uncultured Ruegeria sp.]
MTVFANNLEVSCKKQSNKVIAAFPDVCFTPPQAPPTPPGVPIPYPSFGSDGDTDKGTGTVKIGGETINLKNNSHFTKTTGTEAGSASKKGIVSSKNTGKAKSQAYSMNVKAESKNICRFSDIETNNHGSPPNAPPWPKIGNPNPPDSTNPCADDIKRVQRNCKDQKAVDQSCADAGLGTAKGPRSDGFSHFADAISDASKTTDAHTGSGTAKRQTGRVRVNKNLQDMSNKAQRDNCLAALACKLPDFDEGCPCTGQTGHHMVPASGFFSSGRGEDPSKDGPALNINPAPGTPADRAYSASKAPVICAEGKSHTTGSHGMMHTEMKAWSSQNSTKADLPIIGGGDPVEVNSAKYSDIRDAAVESVSVVFPLSKCDPACLKAQLDAYHVDFLGMDEDQPLRCDDIGRDAKEITAATLNNRTRALLLRFSRG